MPKAIESLTGDDATAFQSAITPHITAVLAEDETLAGAVTSATAAATSETNAAASKIAAAASATAAQSAEDAASTYASASQTHANTAETHATTAETHAATATEKATAAAASETNAAASEAAAATAAEEAAASAAEAAANVGTQASYIVYAVDHEAKFDGVTDDTDAINAAIAALVALSGSFSPAASYILMLPPGRGLTQGGHVIPSTLKVTIQGAGRYVSMLYLKDGSNNFILDVQGQYCTLRDFALMGNRSGNTSGSECLRINAAYANCQSLWIADANGDGLTVGQSTGAIACNFTDLRIRTCKGYGVRVYSGTSTDCQWSGIDVGKSGKSGFYFGASAQQVSNCHSWGNGLEDSSDNHGFNIVSGSTMLSNCEAETNLGRGIYIGSGIKGITISGGTVWGNVANGIYAYGSTHCVVTGASIRNNGVSNTDGASSVAFANVMFGNCQYMTLSGCDLYDDGTSIDAPTYTITPTYAYPGRSAIFTVYAHYAEQSGSNYNTISGNSMRAAQSRGGNAFANVGASNVYSANFTGITSIYSQAAAAALTLRAHDDIVKITGTTAITSIAASYAGRRVTLVFASAGCVVTYGSNLQIASSYTSTAGLVLSLICDGTNWYRM